VVFSSLTFLFLFLPLCLLAYFLVPKIKYKNIILLIFSLFFYSWGEPVWVLLLLISACSVFVNGLIIEKNRGRWQAKAALTASLVINLGLLFSFKYIDFFIKSINILGTNLPYTGIVLPIGISFYTFQTLSYIIDVYRNKAEVNHDFFNFLLFVSLFPQLIAGPILRYTDIQDQLKKRDITWEQNSYGIMRFIFGLGKKVLIANYTGEASAVILTGDLSALTVVEIWLGMLLFAFQIYFDFSGYSDMAIGLGRMFGFKYPENFNYPYVSKSITEFWRRWHISLGMFFRDFVYIPLGGSRRYQIRNICIVWLLTGLWHGSSWNFVAWGMYFCIILIIEKYLLRNILEKLPNVLSWLYAFTLVLFGWVLFYFTDLNDGITAFKSMTGLNGNSLWSTNAGVLLVNNSLLLALSFFIALGGAKKLVDYLLTFSKDIKAKGIKYAVTTGTFIIIMALSIISLLGSSYNPFLYFRF
jgi:alginate O-acetyltransferase complex protein AlgI